MIARPPSIRLCGGYGRSRVLWSWSFPIIALAYSLGGCTGLLVPNIQEFYHADPRYEQLEENKVVFHIQCELHKAIYNVINDPHYERQPGTHFNDIGWLNEWGAKV